MIAALYVQTGGAYYGLADVDPWDEARDARKYAGPWPAVAHPPCNRWCMQAMLAHVTHGSPPPGEDGGTFAASLAAVRKWGGVLEHPRYSAAFLAHGLKPPTLRIGWQATFCGGWVCEVQQGHYGHRAHKPTWLYAYGITPPPLKWGVSQDCEGLKCDDLWSDKRSKTPPTFRDLLLDMAGRAAR